MQLERQRVARDEQRPVALAAGERQQFGREQRRVKRPRPLEQVAEQEVQEPVPAEAQQLVPAALAEQAAAIVAEQERVQPQPTKEQLALVLLRVTPSAIARFDRHQERFR